MGDWHEMLFIIEGAVKGIIKVVRLSPHVASTSHNEVRDGIPELAFRGRIIKRGGFE